VDVGAQWQPADYGRNLAQYLRLTAEALDAGRAPLVVWPESAMTFFLEEEPDYRRAVAGVLAPRGAELVAGAPRAADARHATFSNSAFLLAPDGAIAARYDKQRLLPFAEYFPLSVDLLRRRFGRVRQFTPGEAAAPLDTVAGRAGVLICNEAFFGDLAAARVRDGATLLVSLANDTWVSDAQFARMALDMARLRAVEQRRWLVRASTWGPSALVDPFGRTTVATEPATAATIAGTIEPLGGVSPYARLGDAFAVACALVTLAALAVRPRP
jgi:apolipoprotein N-acyltransferase